jgi:hypothetical protein
MWEKEIRKNPENEEAWYSYFFAARYGWSNDKVRTYTREALMDSIYNEMGRAIPNSWVYHYIHYYNYGDDFNRLEKAYEINPNEPDLYWEFIKEFLLRGMKDKRSESSKKLYNSEVIHPGILSHNYNTLVSCNNDAILFTNGDNDTYPALMLQDVKSIRPDVSILNIHGIYSTREYLEVSLKERGIKLDTDELSYEHITQFLPDLLTSLNKTAPDTPIHFSLAFYKPYFEHIKNNISLEGFVYTYDKNHQLDEEKHKDIITNRLQLDYLEYGWYNDLHVSEPLVNQLNLNYVEPFLLLAEYYNSQDDNENAQKWKNKALMLAKRGNDKSLIMKIKDKEW